jgi:hypothetical protein
MTLEVQAFLLCDSVMRDAQTGKAIIHGVFDRIWATNFPAVHKSCAAYFRIRIDDVSRDYKLELVVVTPSGLRQPMPEIPLAVANSLAEGNINIEGLPLPEAGSYEIELRINKSRVARFFLTVLTVGTEEQTHGRSIH